MLKILCGIGVFAGVLAAANPACNLVPGWTPQGEARSFVADNLFEYMDGNAEGYLLYGFQNMHGVTCVKDGVTLVIDISDFGDADSAYGMFCANRDLRRQPAKLGMGGQIVPRRAIFAKGPYYVEIGAEPEGDHTAILQTWTAAMEKIAPGTNDVPAALSWFPSEGQQSLRLVPESVLGMRILKRGYVAQYDFGKAFVVTEASPEAAAAVIQKLRERFGETAKAPIAGDTFDDAFQVTDKYLGRICIARKGRYLAGYGNLADGQDAVKLAAALAARLP
jgi:plasmid stabilization system protein ParE